MLLKQNLFLLGICCFFMVNRQEGFHFKKTTQSHAKVPFRLIGNLMVLEVKLNEIPLSFILDTGANHTFLFNLAIKDSLELKNIERYILENPYGLGIKENTLFVCDGTAGLKLFNKTDPVVLQLFEQYEDIQAKDVIPLENSLLMIGNNTLYQYEYVGNGINLISSFLLE